MKKSFIINILLGGVLLLMLFSPDAKAIVIEGLMKVGFYTPDVAEKKEAPVVTGVRFKNGDGSITDLGELKGKVVFINFWATWCPPCRAEMPSINKLYKKLKSDPKVVFITVDADNNYSRAKKFLDKRNYEMPLYLVASTIPENIFAGVLPTTVIIDKKGRLVFMHEGAADYADAKFIAFIDKLSKE